MCGLQIFSTHIFFALKGDLNICGSKQMENYQTAGLRTAWGHVGKVFFVLQLSVPVTWLRIMDWLDLFTILNIKIKANEGH